MVEYPFKDLLPLDEVLEREGYYKDWTHLDPEVFYSLTQISEYIKTKGYGVDVRLLIAQLAEHFGLSVVEVTDIANDLIARQSTVEDRQDAVEQFNTQVIQEMTDKDVISAPEIIEARQGEDKLSLRLQRDFNRHKKVLDNRGVNPLDFGCVADGVTDDTDAFQLVMDFAIANERPIIVTGKINIAGTLIFRKIYDRRFPLRVEGGGKLIKRNAGYMFSSDVTYEEREVYAGNIRFSNLSFESIEGNSTAIIDSTKILRVYFNNCDIINVDYLIKSTGDTYAQTIYLDNTVVVGGKGYFIDVPEIYDFSFVHSVCENRESLIRIANSYHSLRIFDSVIEGLTGQVANIRWGKNLAVSNNYFEHNTLETNAPYIEFTFGNTIDSTSAVIDNNHFVATDEQRDSGDFYLIKARSLSENIAIENNFVNANLLDVLEEASLTPSVLTGLMTNRTDGEAKLTKAHKRVPVQLGQGNLLTGYDYPNQIIPSEDFIFANTTVTKTSSLENALAIRAVGGGVTTNVVGFRTESVMLRAGENVVIGIEGKPMTTAGGSPQIFVSIVGEDEDVVYKENTHHVRTIANIENLRFISLPSLKISKTQNYYVSITIERETSFGIDHQYFLIYNLYLQYGTVSNKSS